MARHGSLSLVRPHGVALPDANWMPGHEFVSDPEVVRRILSEALEELEYVTPKDERRRIIADVIEELDLDAPGE